MGKYDELRWFYFEDGSNPYGVYGDNFNEFFKMVIAQQPEIINNRTLKCPKKPKAAYYQTCDYWYKKATLREFAIEYQYKFANFSSTWGDVSWWTTFFEIYGRKYGLIKEFRENGII